MLSLLFACLITAVMVQDDVGVYSGPSCTATLPDGIHSDGCWGHGQGMYVNNFRHTPYMYYRPNSSMASVVFPAMN
jgi:hypothetical protein